MTFNHSLCDGCPIQNRHEVIEPKGNLQGRFLVVTENPKPSNRGRLLPGKQMEIFAEQMQAQGYGGDDFAFTPLCHCPYDQDDHTNKEKKEIHNHCRQHLLSVVESKEWDAIIPLGAAATSQVFNKSTKITKVRGYATVSEELSNTTVFPLLSPSLVALYPQNAPLFNADVASFARHIDGAGNMEVGEMYGNYRIVDDLEFLIEQDPEIVWFDIEATGLRWYQQGCDVRSYRPNLHKGSSIFKPRYQILTMQFTVKAGEAYMLVWDHPERPIPEQFKPRMRNQLRRLLCKPDRLVIGQNTKHDNVSLWKTEGIRFRIGGDSLMLASLHDENMTEKNLDVLTKIFAPEMAGYADKFNATVDKSRMWEVPLSDLLPYGCGDTDATCRVYTALEEKIAEDDKLWAHYCHVSIPGLNALAAMETEGMHVDDQEALPTFKAYMREEVARMGADLLAAVPRAVKRDEVAAYCAKNKGADAAAKALSFTRGEFLKNILFNHPQGFRLKPKVFTKTTAKLKDESKREPSTSSKDHLPYFFDECPFTQQLAEYVKDARLLGTNVEGFETKYIVGSKVRPTYSLSKTVTGRTSSEDPNGQNYPKRGPRAKVYRKMFVPPPGYYVCELDLSQAELRIAACLSGDRTMLEIYRTGGDIHKSTALIVAGITLAEFEALPKDDWVDRNGVKKDGQKMLRFKAKAVNFGFLYGMGWRKFIGYAKTQYGVDFTENESKRIRKGFFTKYRRLESWHESVREYALEHKQVRSYSGRVRHLPMIDSAEEYVQQEAIRQAINSPVQEFGSSLGVMALGRMNEEIDPTYLKVVGFIHDAIVVYVKKEYLDWGLRTVKRYMQSNPLKEWFGVELPAPIVADCGFGLNLGEIHECEGFSLDEPFDYSSLRDKQGNLLIEVPRQRIPARGGRLCRSPYTLDTDLEDEDAPVVTGHVRSRIMRAAVTKETVKRIERSKKQMVINKRIRRTKLQEDRVIRRTVR